MIECKLYMNSQVKTEVSKKHFAQGRLLALSLGSHRVVHSLFSAVGERMRATVTLLTGESVVSTHSWQDGKR